MTCSGGDGIAAYILPAPGASAPGPAELREHLAAVLPGYMIPAAYVSLAALPLSGTGKINRAALPAPAPSDTIHAPYTPPATPAEHLIAALYTDILGHPTISAHDNFFDLGGNSLQAALVLDRITELTGAEIRVRDVLTPRAGRPGRPDRSADGADGDIDQLAAEAATRTQMAEARERQAEQDGRERTANHD
jgi:hypothetical protein